jgi:hypothetical protein
MRSEQLAHLSSLGVLLGVSGESGLESSYCGRRAKDQGPFADWP